MKGLKRILSLVLSSAVLLNTAAFTAIPKADTVNELIKITGFEALSDSILKQDVPLGTTLESLNLPDTLTVTIAPGQTKEEATEAATEELTTEAATEITSEELTTAATAISTEQAAEAPIVTTEKTTEKEPEKATEAEKTTEAPKTTEAEKTTEAPKSTEAEKTTEAPKTTEAEKAAEAPADKPEAGITQKITNEVLSGNTFEVPSVTDIQVPDVQELHTDDAQTITLTNITWKDLMGNYDPTVKMNHKFVPELPEGYVAQSSILPVISVNVGKIAEFPSFAEQIQALSNPKGRSTSLTTGNGTQAAPFLISSIEDLALMRDLVNEDAVNATSKIKYAEAYYLLTTDLDFLEEPGNWTPIGCLSKGDPVEDGTRGTIKGIFRGDFNGATHTIANLKVDSTSKYQGLFGYVGATIMRNNTAIPIGVVKDITLISSDASRPIPNTIGCLTSSGKLLMNNEFTTTGCGYYLNNSDNNQILISDCRNITNGSGYYAPVGFQLTDILGNAKPNSPHLYCFTHAAEPPVFNIPYLTPELFSGQSSSITLPNIDTNSIEDNIRAALHGGYPIDACGYSDLLTDVNAQSKAQAASSLTQSVIWTLLGQITESSVTNSLSGSKLQYFNALLNYAKTGKLTTPKPPTITLSCGETVDFNKVQETGFTGYKTNLFYFNISGGTFSLELPSDVTAYEPAPNGMIKYSRKYKKEELENFDGTKPLILASTDRPDKPGYAMITITNVRYLTPENVVIYATPETIKNNTHKEYQKMIGYETKENIYYGNTKFTFKVKVDGTEVPEEPTTTEAPTTEAPTTEAPTTEAPTTEAPTTEAPTTEAPTTEAPTTEAPATTTQAPSTSTPPTTPSNPGTGTTTPPTTVTPPEVIVPDEDTPLAPGPDAYLPDDNDPNSDENKNIEDDATNDDDTIIDDDEVPLAKLPEETKKPDTSKKDTTEPSVTIDVPEDEVPLANLPKTGQEQSAMSQNAFFMMLGAFGLAAGLSLLAMASKKSFKATKAAKRNKK